MSIVDHLQFIINNIFLPPRLPQSDEEESGATALLSFFYYAAISFANQLSGNEREYWRRLGPNIRTWADVYDGGTPCETKIARTISAMCLDGKFYSYVVTFFC